MKTVAIFSRLVLLCAMVGLGTPAVAQSPSNANVGDANTQDYLQKAGMADAFEVETSQLATRRATSPDVKAFAEMMIKDHTASTERLAAAAKAQNIVIDAAKLDESQQTQIDVLAGPSPTKLTDPANHGETTQPTQDFDTQYMQLQIGAHESALALHRGYADKGSNAALKGVAREIAAKVETHLAEARRLAGN
jgi:putative membrane protein